MAAGQTTTSLKQISLSDDEVRPISAANETFNQMALILANENRAFISVKAPAAPDLSTTMTAPNAAEFTSQPQNSRTLCGDWKKTNNPEEIEITLTGVATGTDLTDTQPLESPITVTYQAKGKPEASFIRTHG